MSVEGYDHSETGSSYNLLLLVAALAAAQNISNAQESIETVTTETPSKISQPLKYDYESLRALQGTVTEYDTSMNAEYQGYMDDMENVQKLLIATKLLTDDSDQLDPEFSNIIQKNFMDLLD